MMDNEYREAMTETLWILRNSEESVIAKIPIEIIRLLKENAISSYSTDMDYNDNIELKPKTRAMLALLYRDYLCNEEEKVAYNKKLQENENRYQEQLNEKYKDKEIFSNKGKEETALTLETIENKQNLFQKIIAKIKGFFKIN